ncbi:MAG: hypothetical protein IJ495_03200 [Bacteroidales bacterium]|nr:hypothetical protein [Bacteroidales bacterium]
MKKWSKLVLATMLSVGTLLVSGCIENIEPEGIADLRGAKAELLRAQTALQAAQAAKVEADAALVLAQAKVQEAIAKQEEARVAYVEAEALAAQYRAEREKLINEGISTDNQLALIALENQIAAQEAAKADAERQAALAAEEFKIEMLDVLKRLEEAQLSYDQALLDIELARNTLTFEQESYLNSLLQTVKSAKAAVVEKTRNLEDATETLTKALATVDEAEAKNVAVRAQTRTIARYQAELEGLKEAQAEMEALLELDPDLTDWDAERAALEEEIAALDKEMKVLEKEREDKEAETEKAVSQLNESIDLYENTTGYLLDYDNSSDDPEDWGTGLFKKIQNPYAISEYITVPDVQIKNDVLGDFQIIGNSYAYGEEDEVIRIFDNAIMEYKYADMYFKHYDLYWNEASEAEIAKKESAEDYLASLERYNDAVAATKTGDYLAYFAKHEYTVDNGYPEDYDFVEEVATYNEALKAFKAGIAEYEAEEVRLTVDQIQEEEIQNAYDSELATLTAERAKGYQDAEAKYAAAEAKYDKAYYVNEAAKEKRDRAIEVAEKTADATEAEMETFEATYVEAAASDEDKTKHALYVKALADIKKARDDYQNPDPEVKTDPESIWAAAQEQWIKDQELYDYAGGYYAAESLYAGIDKSYADKKYDLDNKYAIIWAEFYAKYPNFSTEYRNEWVTRLDDLRTGLQVAVNALNGPVDDMLRPSGSFGDVEYAVNLYAYDGSDYGTLDLDIYYVPEFLTDGDELVEVVAADLVDKDFFVWKDVASQIPGELVQTANTLWYEAEVTVYFKDGTSDNCYLYADDNSEWPYVLPDYDTFVDMFEYKIPAQSEIDYIEFASGQGYLADIYMEKLDLDIDDAEDEAYYAAIPDHIKAIETAKAEFIEYVKTKNAELDALKAEIEKTVPAVIEEYKAYYAEYTAAKDKKTVLDEKLTNLEDIIETFCLKADPSNSAADLEALVEALEQAYEDAVEAVALKEDDIISAEETLQGILDGLVTALTMAQRDYEDAEAELEEAQAELEKASEELEAAIALIYGEEEIPEDPAPETPAA